MDGLDGLMSFRPVAQGDLSWVSKGMGTDYKKVETKQEAETGGWVGSRKRHRILICSSRAIFFYIMSYLILTIAHVRGRTEAVTSILQIRRLRPAGKVTRPRLHYCVSRGSPTSPQDWPDRAQGRGTRGAAEQHLWPGEAEWATGMPWLDW